MILLIIQTIFLLAVAFVLGAIAGYLLKRYFGCPEQAETDSGTQNSAAASAPASVMSSSDNSNSSRVDAATTTNHGDNKSDEKPSDAQASGSTSSTETSPQEDVSKSSAGDAKASIKSSQANKAKPPVAKKKASAAKKTTSPTKPAAPSVVANKSAPVKKTTAKSKTIAASNDVDDLKLIKGVGKLNEARLNDEGVTTFSQVAAWKKADIADFDEKLNFKGRIEREEWVPQAKALVKAKPKAAAPKMASAMSVPAKAAPAKTAAKKSTTAVTKKPAPKKATPKAAPVKATPDDLKLIKGVGKLIESKLAKEGITQYSQIAGWKKEDIVDFDEKLSFKGRIERDEWISQAKLLAKGGTTEFSKRAAKGEVPSSASKK